MSFVLHSLEGLADARGAFGIGQLFQYLRLELQAPFDAEDVIARAETGQDLIDLFQRLFMVSPQVCGPGRIIAGAGRAQGLAVFLIDFLM